MSVFTKYASGAALGIALLAGAAGVANAQSAEPADATKIVIGQGNSGTSHIPIYVALDQGFFKKAGLDVTRQLLSGGTPSVMAAFASNSVNIINLSAPELIHYVGAKVIAGKAFGELVDHNFDLLVSKDIKSFADIKGKTIGISGQNSGDQIFILGLLQKNGMSAKDVTFITSGNPLNRLAAMSAGSIQVTSADKGGREESGKVGTILVKADESPVQFPSNVLITSKDLLDNHKPLLKKFVAVMAEATTWMKANPAAAAGICAKVLNATVEFCNTAISANFDRTMTSKYTWSSTFAVNLDGIKSALEVMSSVEPATKGMTVEDVTDTSLTGTTP